MNGAASAPEEPAPLVRLRDVRMVPVALTAWAVALLVTFAPALSGLVIGAAGIGGLLLLVLHGARGADRGRVLPAIVRAAPLAVVCAGVAAAIGASVAVTAAARDEAAALAGHAVSAEVSVRSLASPGADGRLWMDADTIRIGPGGRAEPLRVPVRIGIRADRTSDTLGPGTVLRFTAQTTAADAGERAVLVLFASGDVAHVSRGRPIEALAGDVRAAFIARTQRLPDPGAELLPGLAVGDVRAVTAELDAAMKASGLSHLTAVSGSNLALVAAAGFGLVTALGGGRTLRVVVAAVGLAGFVILVTPQPSVIRAAGMAGVAMLAVLLGRPRAGLSVLLLAVTVLLLADPRLAAAPGFALSAAATAGLIVLAPPLARGLRRWLPGPLALAVAVPLSAQLACGPIIALFAPQQSLVGVPANLLAAPASPIATVLGLLACLCIPLPPVADLCAAAAWLPSAWIAQTALVTAGLPGATIAAPAGADTALVIALLSAGVFWAIVRRPPLRGRARILLGAALAAAVGMGGGWAVLTGPVAVAQRPDDWAIAACDVGQGDAVLVRSAARTMLIDTGPDPGLLRRCLDELGIARLDLLVLTHFDHDHAGAADELAGRADVVLHGPTGTAQQEGLLRRLAQRGARLVDAAAGMTGRLGDANWRVLWPRREEKVFPPGNDVGVVVEVSGGGVPRSLFLADLSAASQGMLRRIALPHDETVVKVAHHGSADQDPQLYAALNPALALISVGEGNDYGHPRQKTLDMLRALGVATLRTDQRGMILVSLHEEGLRVWAERPTRTGTAPPSPPSSPTPSPVVSPRPRAASRRPRAVSPRPRARDRTP